MIEKGEVRHRIETKRKGVFSGSYEGTMLFQAYHDDGASASRKDVKRPFTIYPFGAGDFGGSG